MKGACIPNVNPQHAGGVERITFAPHAVFSHSCFGYAERAPPEQTSIAVGPPHPYLSVSVLPNKLTEEAMTRKKKEKKKRPLEKAREKRNLSQSACLLSGLCLCVRDEMGRGHMTDEAPADRPRNKRRKDKKPRLVTGDHGDRCGVGASTRQDRGALYFRNLLIGCPVRCLAGTLDLRGGGVSRLGTPEDSCVSASVRASVFVCLCAHAPVLSGVVS